MKKLLESLLHSLRAPGDRSPVTEQACPPELHWHVDPPRAWHTEPDVEGLLHVIPDPL